MGLHVADFVRGDPRTRVRRRDDVDLSGNARGRVPNLRPPVVVRRGRADDGVDRIAIAQRCKEVGRNPRIVRYEDDLPTMTLFAWHAHGRPVHGMKKL